MPKNQEPEEEEGLKMKDELLKKETWIVLNTIKNNPLQYETQILVSKFKKNSMKGNKIINPHKPKRPRNDFFDKLEDNNLIQSKETPPELPKKAERRNFYSITDKGGKYLDKLSNFYDTAQLRKNKVVKASQ